MGTGGAAPAARRGCLGPRLGALGSVCPPGCAPQEHLCTSRLLGGVLGPWQVSEDVALLQAVSSWELGVQAGTSCRASAPSLELLKTPRRRAASTKRAPRYIQLTASGVSLCWVAAAR